AAVRDPRDGRRAGGVGGRRRYHRAFSKAADAGKRCPIGRLPRSLLVQTRRHDPATCRRLRCSSWSRRSPPASGRRGAPLVSIRFTHSDADESVTLRLKSSTTVRGSSDASTNLNAWALNLGTFP